MADGFIQVAPDSTGSKLQTYTRTVGGQTVHVQAVTEDSVRTRTGFYRGADGTAGGLTVLATAHAATAGFLWLFNPVASTVAVAVKAAQFTFGNSAATAAINSPRINVERMTATGTLTATAITVAQRVRTTTQGNTADTATPQAKLVTATTGLTPTAGPIIRSWQLPADSTAVGMYGGVFDWDPDTEDDEMILAPGEGIVWRQADNGNTTTDTRRISISVVWEEFTAP